jgi:hypothetical protein
MIDYSVLGSLQDHLKTGTRDLDHPILASAKNTNSWHARKRDLQPTFCLDVLMVPSSVISITGERLTCDGFSLGETVRLGNFEFVVDYFSGLSLSPRRGNAGTAFMGTTHSGASTPRWPMIEDSAEEFLMVSHGYEGSGLPSPRRCGTGASLALIKSTPRMENAPATQATMTVP